MEDPDEIQNRLSFVASRNRAAVAELSAVVLSLSHEAVQMMSEGNMDEGLDLCEKVIARLEGTTMALRRIVP